MDRRSFLSRAVPAAAGLAFPAAGYCVAARGEPVVSEIGAHLWMVSGLGGNVVVFDHAGRLFIDGRDDEMIVSGGDRKSVV